MARPLEPELGPSREQGAHLRKTGWAGGARRAPRPGSGLRGQGWVSYAEPAPDSGPRFHGRQFPTDLRRGMLRMARARSLHCAFIPTASASPHQAPDPGVGTPGSSRPEPDTEKFWCQVSTPQPTPPTVSPSLPPSEGQKHPHPQRPPSGALACPSGSPTSGSLTFSWQVWVHTVVSSPPPCPQGSVPSSQAGPAHSRTGGWRVCSQCSHGCGSSSEAPWT